VELDQKILCHQIKDPMHPKKPPPPTTTQEEKELPQIEHPR